MQVVIENGRMLVIGPYGTQAYEGMELVSAKISQVPAGDTSPYTPRALHYPDRNYAYVVVVSTATGPGITIPMGQVDNHPSWTDTREGVETCLAEINDLLKRIQCCCDGGTGADPVTVEVNGVAYGTYTGGTAPVSVMQGGVPVGTLSLGVWEIPPPVVSTFDVEVYLDGALEGTVTGVDPTVDNTMNIILH